MPNSAGSLSAAGLVLSLLLAGVGTSAAANAEAAPAADDSARALREQGRAAFERGRFEEAIAEYRKAYELRADPDVLFDIAEAYRRLDVPERAVFFYRRYLTTHPDPPHRSDVEEQIARLSPPGSSTSSLPVAPLAISPGQRTVDLSTPATATVQERPLLHRWWFWTAVGVLAAGGAAVAIAVANHHRNESVPPSDLGHLKFFY